LLVFDPVENPDIAAVGGRYVPLDDLLGAERVEWRLGFLSTAELDRALAIYRGLQRLSDDPEWQRSGAYQIALCEERGHMTVQAKADYQRIVDRVKERPAGRPLDSATAELGRMAGWRLEQIAWQEKTEEHLDGLFAKDASAGPDGGKPPVASAPRS